MRHSFFFVALLSSVVGCSSSSSGDPAASAGTGGNGAAGAAGASGAGGSAGAGPLAAPPMGQGFQLATGPFEVPPGTEEQDCYFFKAGDVAGAAGVTGPLNVHRIQIQQRVGSHHMNLFRVKTIVNLGPDGGAVQKGTNGMGECFKSPNWADWPLVANSQQGGQLDWTFPDGVANVIQPDEWLMLQTHYVNATTQMTPESQGDVKVNLWTVPKEQVTAEMGTVFATKQSIRICQSNPKPTYDGTCQLNSPSPTTIIGANAHFHGRGKEFDMFNWDGTSTTRPDDAARFYQSTTWAEPPMATSLNVAVGPKGGVWYSCGFEWMPPDPSVGCDGLNAYDETKWKTAKDQQDCCYTFGPIVDKNEHCNIFVYYYPKQDNVFCN